jgi:type I toxin-antitoxin system toxin SymE
VRPLDLDESEIRFLTVTRRKRKGKVVPEIRMSGDWLAAAWLTPGCKLAVTVHFGSLLVTIAERPPEEVKRVRAAVEDLQREYRRRFQYKRHEEQ